MRLALCFVIGIVASLAMPPLAEACSCGGTLPSSTAVKAADVVFVGTIARVEGPKPLSRANPDGSISGGVGTGASAVTFDTTHVFRGNPVPPITIVGGGTDCDEPFRQGETWLVYAQTRDGRLTTHKCTRTRLRETASQDLAYLEGLEQGRPQGVVYGEVFSRCVDADKQPQLCAPQDSSRLEIVAVGAGRRFAATPDRFGPYQIVLPPGLFEIWLEKDGKRLATEIWVRGDGGRGRRLSTSEPLQLNGDEERQVLLIAESN